MDKKLFLGGSKSYLWITEEEWQCVEVYLDQNWHILIGDCRGTDRLLQHRLDSIGYKNVTIYATDGQARYNVGHWPVVAVPAPHEEKDYDYYRCKDRATAQAADDALMFWDGESKGTIQNVFDVVMQKKKATIVRRPLGAVRLYLRKSGEEKECSDTTMPTLPDEGQEIV